jgi:hypothetical protein
MHASKDSMWREIYCSYAKFSGSKLCRGVCCLCVCVSRSSLGDMGQQHVSGHVPPSVCVCDPILGDDGLWEKLQHYLWPTGSVMPSSDRMLHWLDVASVRCNQISGGSVLCRHNRTSMDWTAGTTWTYLYAWFFFPYPVAGSQARHEFKRFARKTVDEKYRLARSGVTDNKMIKNNEYSGSRLWGLV